MMMAEQTIVLRPATRLLEEAMTIRGEIRYLYFYRNLEAFLVIKNTPNE